MCTPTHKRKIPQFPSTYYALRTYHFTIGRCFGDLRLQVVPWKRHIHAKHIPTYMRRNDYQYQTESNRKFKILNNEYSNDNKSRNGHNF